MKRSWKIGIAVAGALVVALAAGGAALASGHLHEGFVKRRITRHIDAALDAVGATPAQRDAVYAARDQVFTTIEENHRADKGDFDAALTLWQADRLDPAGLATLRARHLAAAKKTSDAVVQAFSDAHDALTSAQRAKLADFLRAHRPPLDQKSMEGARPFMKHMVSERVDDVLDQIHATAEQRATITAAVERVFAAMSNGMSDHAAHFDEAIALFTADKIDPARLAALQSARQAEMQQIGDTIVQSLTEVHDALDAGQRKQVAELVRSHHSPHGG